MTTGSLVFPQPGLAFKASKWTIEGVEFTLEAARNQQMDAAVFGRRGMDPIGSLNNLCSRMDFFQSSAVTNFSNQSVSKGQLSRATLGRVTHTERRRMWDFHIGQVEDILDESNADICAQGWSHLEKYWKVKCTEVKLAEWERVLGSRLQALKEQMQERALEERWPGAGRYVLVKMAKGTWHWKAYKCTLFSYEALSIGSPEALQVAEAISYPVGAVF
ncbi:MAG: hypothetical protein HYY01_14265 [Chloroflexi bacterium]|nr:hypothetical protein [Chloroflexota bacterium]